MDDVTFWRNRRVLLTGATGLVGSWVLQRLSQRGADPVCLIRDHVPRSRAVSERILSTSTIVSGRLEDYEVLERTLNEYEIDVVIHLAAQTIIGIANANPLSTFESNVRGTWNLLEACRRNPRIVSIVIASSDKAYGRAEELPYDEQFPLRGSHPYDVSKSCADLIAISYHETYRLPIAVTRCGNFYGGGDLNWNRIVPGTIRSLILGESPIVRSDGSLRRDYLYVEDAVTAYLQLAERVASDESVHGEAFNFSNEDPRTVLEIVELMQVIAGRTDLAPTIRGDSTNEIHDQFLSAEKARSVLNWQPQFSMHSGLDLTYAWYQDYLAEAPAGSRGAD